MLKDGCIIYKTDNMNKHEDPLGKYFKLGPILIRPGKKCCFPASWGKFPSSRADFPPVWDGFPYAEMLVIIVTISFKCSKVSWKSVCFYSFVQGKIPEIKKFLAKFPEIRKFPENWHLLLMYFFNFPLQITKFHDKELPNLSVFFFRPAHVEDRDKGVRFCPIYNQFLNHFELPLLISSGNSK